jgi:hypothetical protein
MIDITQWELENSKENSEANKAIFETINRGSTLSLLDLAPQFRDILEDHTYGWWSPPNETDDLKNPARRLITTLTTAFSPEVVLVPLVYHIRNKGEFVKSYGLTEEYGILFEDFLDLVKLGRIRLFIPSKPSSYTSSFYQEIFRKCRECEQGSYLPPQYSARFSSVTAFGNLKQEFGSDLNREKLAEILDRDKFGIQYWQNLAKGLISNISLSEAQIELHSKGMGTDACELYLSGFPDLIDLLFEKLSNNPRLLEIVLRYYSYYLIKGYSDGLGGLRFYAPRDVGRMSFYRLIPKKEREKLRKLIECSPAAATVITNPLDSLLISRPDHAEVKRVIKSDLDNEVKNEIIELQRSIHNSNLVDLIAKSRNIDEILTERLNQETSEHYRYSKLIKSKVRICGTFGLGLALEAASTITAPGTIPLGLSTLLGMAIEQKFLGKQLDHVGRSLAKKWVFRDKGLPSVLWEVSQDSEK